MTKQIYSGGKIKTIIFANWPPVGGIVRRKRSRELRFGEFAPESSAFVEVQKLRKCSHDIWSYLDILRPCTKKSDHVVHDLKDKNTMNKMQ